MDQQQIIILIISILVALLIGFLIGKSIGKSQNSGQQKAEEELQNYKDAVKNHFVKSADIVDDLTAQYKNLFDHLGQSAEDLLGKEDVMKLLEERQNKTVTLSYIKEVTPEKLPETEASTDTSNEAETSQDDNANDETSVAETTKQLIKEDHEATKANATDAETDITKEQAASADEIAVSKAETKTDTSDKAQADADKIKTEKADDKPVT